ncbi:unnamed protein product, partial [Rotaria sp. Silwood1]
CTYLNHILPTVYVLLPGKKQRLYTTMLEEIKKLAPDFDPPNVMVDFERASMNAIKNLFPTAILSGCFFHLCQNVYRAVTRFDLKTLYAFLPTTDVITTFDEIKAQFPAEGESVLKYFEEHYRFKKEQCYVDAQIIQAEADVRQARRREQIRR